MKPRVCSNWGSPKCKFFAWLIFQDNGWTVDRLQQISWPNCGLCQLFKRAGNYGVHYVQMSIFFESLEQHCGLGLGLGLSPTIDLSEQASQEKHWFFIVTPLACEGKTWHRSSCLSLGNFGTSVIHAGLLQWQVSPLVLFDKIKKEACLSGCTRAWKV
jgi:hypothetical protein